MNNTAAPSQASINAAKAARFHRVSKVMSGELRGFGSKVERVVITTNACTDGKTIQIPERMHDNDVWNSIMQEAILAHENAHHRYTDFVAWERKVIKPMKKHEVDQLLHKFVNLLEDARINHLFGQDWKGSAKQMQFTHEVFMAQHQEQTTDESPLKQQAMVAMMTEAIAHQPHWFTNQRVIDFMNDNRKLMMNAIKQPSTSDVINQAKRLLKAYRIAFPDDESEDWESDFDGMSDDDLSGRDIERASEQQQAQGRNPEQPSRSRFSDMKEQPKTEPQDSTPSDSDDGDSGVSDSTGDGESSDESGDESGSGAGDESSDESSDTTGDSTGECDIEGDDSSDGNADDGLDCDGDASGDCDGGDGDGDGDGDDHDGDGGDGNGEGDGHIDSDADLNTEDGATGGDSVNSGEFEEVWSELIDRVASEMQEVVQTAHDIDNGHTDGARQEVATVTGKTHMIDEGTLTTDDGHQIHVIAGAKDFVRRETRIKAHASTYNHVVKKNRKVIKRITSEMMRRLKGLDPSWNNYEKQGFLDPKQTWKLGVSGNDTQKIYRKKAGAKEVNGNAIILIDASGSMGSGNRAQDASNAAVVFSEVFRNIGINYEVVDFNTNYGTSMRVRKAFNSEGTSTLDKATIAAPFTGYNNSDGYAVQWCLDRLATMKGSRLLIVISDGAPAGEAPAGESARSHLTKVTNGASKKIGLIGIGIAGQDTSAYYPNAITISDESQIAQEAMPVLRPMLRKIVPRA